jgi:hypothetical protein
VAVKGSTAPCQTLLTPPAACDSLDARQYGQQPFVYSYTTHEHMRACQAGHVCQHVTAASPLPILTPGTLLAQHSRAA